MCGICGIINFNQQKVEEKSLHDMILIMKHRGPDDEGVYLDKKLGTGPLFTIILLLAGIAAGFYTIFREVGKK